jgi:hypothetical protein
MRSHAHADADEKASPAENDHPKATPTVGDLATRVEALEKTLARIAPLIGET